MPGAEAPRELRTARVLLRRWREDDLAPFAHLNADPVVMEHFPGPLDRTASDAFAARIQAHFDEHGFGLWAAEVDGVFAGFTGLAWAAFEAPFTPALEIGWRLARPYWGRGLASEAARAVLAVGLELEPSVVSFTAASNVRSWQVMRRVGMRAEAVFDHPRELPPRIRTHVLYRARRQTWSPHSVLA